MKDVLYATLGQHADYYLAGYVNQFLIDINNARKTHNLNICLKMKRENAKHHKTSYKNLIANSKKTAG